MRALLSVWDKTGIVDLGRSLADLGWELISSGGTFAALSEAGIPVTAVPEVTGAPEMLGGRVKTLHPAIHGGILANRSEPSHLADLDANGIAAIDLVVGNLYPFIREPSVEMIDIGGPTMVRAAAKNHDHVGVVVDPADYPAVVEELTQGALSDATRRRLARKAFAHTAAYDAAIVEWLDQPTGDADLDNSEDSGTAGSLPETPLPETLHLALVKTGDLRYGENPHQHGARYRHIHGPAGWWDTATQHHGKAMSYLNVYDTDAAWRLVHSISSTDTPAAVVIKHANPCGAALGDTVTDAWERAHAGDTVSAFGGIVAVNAPVPLALAEGLSDVFTEVIVAPAFEPEAMAVLQKKKNLRIVTGPPPTGAALHLRSVDGGLLVQTADQMRMDASGALDQSGWSVATEREPTEAEWRDLVFSWRLAAKVSSNCIVMVKDAQAVGIGAGQQNRRDAGRIAAEKSAGRAVGGACASDAFFPFRDGLDAAIEAGCSAVIQPGGSIRDAEVIDAANEAGITMVFTGERHFLH